MKGEKLSWKKPFQTFVKYSIFQSVIPEIILPLFESYSGPLFTFGEKLKKFETLK